MRCVPAIGLAVLVLVGCRRAGNDNKEAAREEFSKAYTCPKERVTVTARPDLKAYDLMVGSRSKPPREVAADPGRLAEWQKRERKLEEDYNRQSIFQATGCDHEETYACSLATGTNETQEIACSKAAPRPK